MRDVPALSVRATNEYGEYDRAALKLYGLEMVVEPFRETVLTISESSGAAKNGLTSTYYWRLVEADSEGLVDDSAKPVAEGRGGPKFSVTFTRPGGWYVLTVEQRYSDDTITAAKRSIIACKYVRRELRDLTQADHDAFFDAMLEFYSLSIPEGEAKYGRHFVNYRTVTAYHNSNKEQFCYHAGVQFLSAHTAFGCMVERSLQMINPKLSLASWDFMIDAEKFGQDWHNSPIFGDDMFGSAINSAKDNFQISSGRFRNISTIYDPDHNLIDSRIDANHNPYGYIDSTHNYQDLPTLTRTSSYCGLKSKASFATSDVFVMCFEQCNNLTDWELCMERKVHGDMHGLLGGAFNCNIDFGAFQKEYSEKYSVELLTFVLEFLTTNFWPDNGFMPDYNSCEMDCERGNADCGCTCNIDAMSISADEVYEISESFLVKGQKRFAGPNFVSYDPNAQYPWGFKKNGERMNQEDTIFLLRHLIKLGCQPGSVGQMSGGASPLDPLFWVLHPIFEKALHILWLSPHYRNAYSFEWKNDGSCNGANVDDALPFTEEALGTGIGTDFLTNAQILSALHPTNPRSTYLYEKFGIWGGSTAWDPCPECSSAVVAEEGQ